MRRLSRTKYLVMALLAALTVGVWGCGGGGDGGDDTPAVETAKISGTVTRGAPKVAVSSAARSLLRVPVDLTLVVVAVNEAGNAAASTVLAPPAVDFSLDVPVGHDYVLQFRQATADGPILAVLEVEQNRAAFSVKAGAGAVALGTVEVDLFSGVATPNGAGLTTALPSPAATSTILADSDKDGIINAAERTDTDADGLPDGFEIASGPGFDPTVKTDPNLDTDGDGLTVIQEAKLGTSDKNTDSDGDGLADNAEDANKNGVVDATETNPALADTDGDVMPDGFEVANGFNALNQADAALDADTDGLTNVKEFQATTDPKNPDTDGDALSDGREVTLTTDPKDPDSDGDGVADGSDSFPKDVLQFAAFQATRLLDPLPTGVGVAAKFSTANAINDSNAIVGASEALVAGTVRVQAAFWDGSQATGAVVPVLLPGLGGTANTYTAALGINAGGFVVGESNDGAGFKAVVWKVARNPAGNQYVVTDGPHALAPLAGDTEASAYGINDEGRVVGESRNTATGVTKAVYWDAAIGGAIQPGAAANALPGPAGLFSAAYAVDADSSDIVGEAADTLGAVHAVAWEMETATNTFRFVDLGTTAHARSSAYGLSMDPQGKHLIVGEATLVLGAAKVAQMWDITQTTTFQFPQLGTATTQSNALAINAEGRIAGWQTSTASPAGGSLVWDANLSSLTTTAPVVPTATSTFSQGYGINSQGTVVGMLQGTAGDQAFMTAQQLP